MPKLKHIDKFDLIGEIGAFFDIKPWMPIIPWIEKNITLVDDVSSESDKPDFTRYPYQVDILKQAEDIHCRKTVTVVSCEQMGKSTMWIYSLLWRMIYDPCQSLVVYPSDSKSVETNQTKIQPLLKHIPGLKEEMQKPRAFRGDRYAFSNLISYFQGSGSKIVSKSCKLVVADEVDQWSSEHPQNLRDLYKRTRSYAESLALVVCSPTTENGHIWQEFMKSSQGYYTLRCKRMWSADDAKL